MGFIGDIIATNVQRKYDEEEIAAVALSPSGVFENGQNQLRLLEGKERHFLPVNDWLFELFKSIARRTVTGEERYTLNFDRLEVLIALGAGSRKEGPWGNYWAPPGYFCFRPQSLKRILSEIRQSLQDEKNGSPYVKSGIFGTTRKQCEAEIVKLTSFLSGLNWR